VLFSRWDLNGNGVISLAEADSGLGQLLGPVMPLLVTIRAFEAARGIASPVHNYDDDHVDAIEFRVLLFYLRYYLKLRQWFAELEANHDKRLSIDDFKHALPILKQWGREVHCEDAERAFHEINCNNGGPLPFEEFAHWVLKQGVHDLEDGDMQDSAEALEPLTQKAPYLSPSEHGSPKICWPSQSGFASATASAAAAAAAATGLVAEGFEPLRTERRESSPSSPTDGQVDAEPPAKRRKVGVGPIGDAKPQLPSRLPAMGRYTPW
jgi:hypothetical protein